MIISTRRDDSTLLGLNCVKFLTEGDACIILEQKEEEDGGRKYDEPCGKAAPEGYAGLCEYGLVL